MLSKEDIDKYLQALGEKVLQKFGPEARIELVVAGGAAIALDYKFRDSTMDIDTYSSYANELEGLIEDIAEEHDINKDWLSHNMMVTSSCSKRIPEYVNQYKLFSGVLDVKTVDALTLICMKSVACRPDSHDMEDIANILEECQDITFDDIWKRFMYLYDDWSLMKADAQLYLTKRFNAMPPDMVEYMKGYLPPSVVSTVHGDELYQMCQEVYRSLQS